MAALRRKTMSKHFPEQGPQAAAASAVVTGAAARRRALPGWLVWWEPLPRRPYWLWLFAAGAVVFHGICFYWMRPFEVVTSEPEAAASLAVYLDPASSQSATLAEQSSLLDFEPMFLPTIWNAEPQRVSVFDRNKRTEPFKLYEAEISRAFATVPAGVAPTLLPQTPQEAVELDSGAIFGTFGRTAAEAVALAGRQGQVQIEALSSLQPQTFVDVAPQTIEGLDGMSMGIGTFLIEVDATGSVTLPLLRRSTGQESADRLWSGYLHGNAAGWNLKPGTYLLTVGP